MADRVRHALQSVYLILVLIAMWMIAHSRVTPAYGLLLGCFAQVVIVELRWRRDG